MNRIKLNSILLLLIYVCSISSSYGSVVTFEDEGTLGLSPIRDGFYGLNWGSFHAQKRPGDSQEDNGYYNGVVSGDYAAWSATNTEINKSGSLFTANSLFITAAWRDDLEIRLIGNRGGKAFFDKTFRINDDVPTFVLLDYIDIDELVLTSSGGIPNPNTLGDGTQFVIDDFTFNEAVTVHAEPIPVPSNQFPGFIILAILLSLIANKRLCRDTRRRS